MILQIKPVNGTLSPWVDQTVGTQEIILVSTFISHVHNLSTYGGDRLSKIFQKGLVFVTALFK